MQFDSNYRIWIVGAYGRVGSAIIGLMDSRYVDLLCTDIDEVDITKSREVKIYADMNRPDVIINCAGMTDVLACEADREAAFRVNALGARNLSIAARKNNSRLIQISTDDVFGGDQNQPYDEFDQPNPQTIYGQSKLAGEMFVREFTPKHMIIRSSWIYGAEESFVKQILAAADKGETIYLPKDQVSSPTSAKELAKVIVQLMNKGEDGTYHVACKGSVSRIDFAKEILQLARKKAEILPALKDQPADINMRPSYSVLDNFMLRLCKITEPIEWKAALTEYMEEIKE